MLKLILLVLLAVVLCRCHAQQPIVKVTKGLGSHGYSSLRISVISNIDTTPDEVQENNPFTYDEPFAWRWEQYRLQSYLSKTIPAGKSVQSIGTDSITVNLPAENTGVRGIVYGDPCTEPDLVGCIHFNDNTTMATRLPRLVNAVAPSTDFRIILGDNLYDQSGDITGRFYRALTPEAQALVEVTVLGNHDIWRMGTPFLRVPKDAFGNGYLQFYGQDTIASKEDPTQPCDLSVDPSRYDHSKDQEKENTDPSSRLRPDSIPHAHNFLSYHKLGNVGFITFSGAHEYESYGNAFEEACSYFANDKVAPSVIYLLGHWNEGHLGCQAGMDVPTVYEKLKIMPGCNAGTLRYAAGHVHCNQVMGTDSSPEKLSIGYMLGGTGVRGESCNTFGFAYVDTTNNRELVVGFELAQDRQVPNAIDIFDTVMTCFEKSGVDNCLQYGTVWRNSTMSAA